MGQQELQVERLAMEAVVERLATEVVLLQTHKLAATGHQVAATGRQVVAMVEPMDSANPYVDTIFLWQLFSLVRL